LAGSTALLLASGCRQPVAAPAAVSAQNLVESVPFYIARRGGSRNWPELTAYAYSQASRVPGLHALEVAVCRSADGVLVCSFDRTTKRLTGRDLTILSEDWATLSRLTVTAAETLDPTQPRRPLARLDDVIDAHIGQFVFFVEPVVEEAVSNLMAKLISLKQPERIVWKQPVNSERFADAKRHGFSTYGYVVDQPAHVRNLQRFAASGVVDMMGTSRTRTDEFIAKVAKTAAASKRTMISWDVRNGADRARLLKLGCTGMAASNIAGLMRTRLKPGELPRAGR
jgi:glycerophosphoryl diester phosphodiesterase